MNASRIAFDSLSRYRQIAVIAALTELGCCEGLIEDEAPETDDAIRVAISQDAAGDIGLLIPTDEEIGQCYQCLAVMSRTGMEEDSDRLFCHSTVTDCLLEAHAEDEALPVRFAA